MRAIERRHWLIALAMVALTVTVLLAMGRPPICTCGDVKLWTGAVQSADNSQHIADWYTPSHIIHGFLFYWFGWLFLRRNPFGERWLAAVAIEAAWELLENSQFIIDRYREATFAFGYNGDSVLNSVADIGWMTLGFLLARRLPVWATVAIAVAFELLTLWTIRDNLTLNVLMLVAPVDAIRIWQAG
ncbi:DUF2585 domain-containing protein [Sphingosinicella sp. LY1275]|uniref:DUF2585 domain-containing protein n=1 Tax=Sphingosinicella sp. LY1275 TaxID=3095379 RepID=UPI002ADEBFF7|nr:DUF2585 domain-containing protein [Sphingosinicella sp. LY1275]MEA1014982.1 DUF2585 domain-containing protein [Sphingosinicella sp. LY1275]